MLTIKHATTCADNKWIDCHYYDGDKKRVIHFEQFSTKSARIETVDLCDFDDIKNRFKTMLPGKVEYIDGIKNVRLSREKLLSDVSKLEYSEQYSCWNIKSFYEVK